MHPHPPDRSDRTAPRPRIRRALLALAVVHPVPSALNAILVAALALIAGGERSVAAVLALAMLGFQFSIGALNDVADVEADRPSRPRKPIPAGLVPIELAIALVVLGGLVGLGISASFGVVVLALGAAGYASGVAYDMVMRRLGLGWLCFAAALPLMLAWTWLAAAGTLPPGWLFLLPLAALAGPALHLANSLVDVDSDAAAQRPSLATRLGTPPCQGGTRAADVSHPRPRVGHTGLGRSRLEPRSRRGHRRDRYDRARRRALMAGVTPVA